MAFPEVFNSISILVRLLACQSFYFEVKLLCSICLYYEIVNIQVEPTVEKDRAPSRLLYKEEPCNDWIIMTQIYMCSLGY